MVERRSIKRQQAILSGRLLFGIGQAVVECGVRDVTTTGALLIVRPELETPDRFDLLIGTGGQMRPCMLIWRKGLSVGVQFI